MITTRVDDATTGSGLVVDDLMTSLSHTTGMANFTITFFALTPGIGPQEPHLDSA